MSAREPSPLASERTPLLSQPQDAPSSHPPSLSDSLDDTQGKKRKRWPTIAALTVLCLAVILICFGLALPSVIEEYAKEGIVFEPTKLTIDSFTSFGVRARIQGDFYMDASKVQHKATRDLGRFGTWIAREVESKKSTVDVFLPDYDDVLLGSATVPPMKLNIRNHQHNHVDTIADLEPGDVDGIRRIAKDFLDQKINSLDVKAVARVSVRSGLINVGKQTITQFLRLQGNDIPSIPAFDLQKLKFAEHGMPGHPDGLKAMAVVSIANEYPVNFDIPSLAFEVLLPDCSDDYLSLGTARTDIIHIAPKQNISVGVTGIVQQLPTSLTSACPGSDSSPLDSFVADYLGGRETIVYIRGGDQDESTPEWIGNLLRDTILPFPLPEHQFDSLIKNFSLEDTHFSLPDLGSETYPKISAIVKVLVGLPPEMNINMDVDKVRADAEVFYKGDLLGTLDLHKWQSSNATKIDGDLLVESIVKEAPLIISDDDVFTSVVHELLFGKGVSLEVHAKVDVHTDTALGTFVVRNIPAQGDIFIKPITGGFKMPEITGMEVVETSEHALTLQAKVNVTNPTEYSASVPYCNVSLLVNGTRVGYAWISADVVPGPNEVIMKASWEVGSVGREWLSQFISGYNTTLTVKTHAGSIPRFPNVGLELTMPTPKIFGHFLKETTVCIMILLSNFANHSDAYTIINRYFCACIAIRIVYYQHIRTCIL